MPGPSSKLRFHCPLSAHWPPLLPLADQSQIRISPEQREEYRLNPHYHCEPMHEIGTRMGTQIGPQSRSPSGLASEMVSWTDRMRSIGYSEDLPVCWVEQPLLGYPEAYWPDPAMQALIGRLAAGEQSLAELDQHCFELLSASHALVLDDEVYQEQRHALIGHWRTRLTHEHYLHIPDLISPLQVAALREYTRQRHAAGPLGHEQSDVSTRAVCLDDPVAGFWHQHVHRVLEQVLKITLRSTHSLIAYYENTALSRHMDDSSTSWNVTIPIDTDPTTAEAAPWPLWLETAHGPTPLFLQLGDALIYKGDELPHWRDALPPDRRETVLQFHFVELDTEKPLV